MALVGFSSGNAPPVSATNQVSNPIADAETRLLSVGMPVEAGLSGGHALVYRLEAAAGSRLRILLDKGDFAVRVSLRDVADVTIAGLVSRRYGGAEIPFTVDADGHCLLEVRSLEANPVERHFRLTVAAWVGEPARHQRAVQAARLAAEAEELGDKWEERASHEAIERYSEAAALWEADGGRDATSRAASMHVRAGDLHFFLSEYDQAIARYERALSLSGRSAEMSGRLDALNSLGYVHVYLGDNYRATRYATRVLALLKRLGPEARAGAEALRAEARALNSLGETRYSTGDLRASLTLFERALALWTSANDRRGEALAHLNLGYSLSDLGERHRAAEHYREALSRSTEIEDRRGVALAQTALGGVSAFLGESRSAFELHGQAVESFRAMGNRQGEAAALNGIAHVYENLNEMQAALEYYGRGLTIYEQIGNRDFAALNRLYVGRIHHLLGDVSLALDYYRECLRLSREVGNRVIEAHALKGIGAVYASQGEGLPAAEHFAAALRLYQKLDNRRGQAYTLNHIAQQRSAAGQDKEALSCYKRALKLIRAVADRRGEAMILFNNAQAERDRGNLDAALSLARESIDIIESLRSNVSNVELRTSYFASVHQHYALYVELLMSLHRLRPGGGYAGEALLACERGRARTLLESLSEEKIDWRNGDPELLRREREIQQRLDAKAEVQMRWLNDRRTEEAAEVAREIHELTVAYEDVRARIRERAPRYAMLTQPALLRLEDIQSEVGDGETLLLEFSLGEKRSYLWEVSADSVEAHELPAAAVIEEKAREVYELLSRRPPPGSSPAPTWSTEYLPGAAELSRMLLSQVKGLRKAKRLLIVADGFLHYIPFEALPEPDTAGTLRDDATGATDPRPLFLRYEIIGLPSAQVLLSIRRDQNRPARRPKTVAVLADPVFDKDDPRVLARAGAADGVKDVREIVPQERGGGDLERALRDVDRGAGVTVWRVPATLREARSIVSLVPHGSGLLLTGFDANRDQVSSEVLSEFRILHFATHGIVDNEHPELSGIILSLVNEQGQRRDGFLRLHDIYQLTLPAELVVLSACRTGLGKDVHGEGVMGLTRGFMYAGSKGVVATLWQVDDDATAFFMERFYTAMLRDNATPAAALQSAKREMWQHDKWRQPYFWAAFVLQGEYTSRFGEAASEGLDASVRPSLWMGMAALAVLGAGLYAFRRRRCRRPA
jgi:CHAT domain-containing protein/tetratricopeptide (TPR) repeat protein